MYDTIELEKKWDKVFKKSDKVNHKKITFKNKFGITLVADLYDKTDIIPFDKIVNFYKEYLK